MNSESTNATNAENPLDTRPLETEPANLQESNHRILSTTLGMSKNSTPPPRPGNRHVVFVTCQDIGDTAQRTPHGGNMPET
jgi:hypothetical protein